VHRKAGERPGDVTPQSRDPQIEAAHALGLSKSTASQRYVRALNRLREILAARRGGLSEP
jgi:hypothetical protein